MSKYTRAKMLVAVIRGKNASAVDFRTRRKRSPRKLEPHEVIAKLKARKVPA